MEQRIDGFDMLKKKMQLMVPSLPRGERAAAEYLTENLPRIGALNLSTIAAETNSSSATVIRLCKRMGYSGFLDFRNSVRMAAYKPENEDAALSGEQLAMWELMRSVIDKNNETMMNTLALVTDQYVPAAQALLKANMITLIGNGDAVIPCQLIGMKLMKIGKPCVVVNDQDMQMFSSAATKEGDVVLAVSHTGRSKSVVEAMRIAREHGAITIGVTASGKAPLLKHCVYALMTGTVDNTTAGDIISRRIAEQTILETLYLYIVECSNGEAIEEVKKQGAQVIEQMTKLSGDEGEAKP